MGRLACGFFLLLLNVVLHRVNSESADTLFLSRSALRGHLVNHFNQPRNEANIEQKQLARDYVKQFFDNIRPSSDSRSSVTSQRYNVSQYEGVNYIYTLPGDRWETAGDKPIVVGAHYDTHSGKPGVNDNGSGMSALLEIAKIITNTDCKRLNTIYFVAFDFEEYGLLGSEVFVDTVVRSFLTPSSGPKKTFSGAFILETMMNYDNSNGSQILPPTLKPMIPVVAQAVESDGYRGNFLAVIGRQTDSVLADKFLQQYNAVPDPTHSDNKHKIYKVTAPFDGRPSVLPEQHYNAMSDLFRSDHSNFWDYDGAEKGLMALFITDTADFRGYMQTCYHQACDDVSTTVTDENIDFLAKTATAVTNTVLQLATEGDTCAILDPWRSSLTFTSTTQQTSGVAVNLPKYPLVLTLVGLCASSCVARIHW